MNEEPAGNQISEPQQTAPGSSEEPADVSDINDLDISPDEFIAEEPVEAGVSSDESTALEIVREAGFQISLPSGWARTDEVPEGLDVGFRKELQEGNVATLFFHLEQMPQEFGEPPADTSGMKRQWDTMLRNEYPDLRPVDAESPVVSGILLVNGTYELTDNGERLRRRYTYFISERTAFVVQCSALPSDWETALDDFDLMLASLNPGTETYVAETITDDAAIAELENDLPIFIGSFPLQWECSLIDVSITNPDAESVRTLGINLAFNRQDIADIYTATKLVFGLLSEGASEEEFNNFPPDLQAAAFESGPFIEYVGQLWGLASGYIANCDPLIDEYKITISDSARNKVGSVSISREDGTAIIMGEVTEADSERVAGMYVFE